ncbi:MAG TPA: polyphosphate kinase 1 [Deltaproteobacteria bacterium]|nr:polyphosphate kinase 1 [Deltaproteobacteria bacterium]
MSELPRVPPPDAPYVNRELSWLQFNARVLGEALDESNPLLERLRFLTIFHTNLDEFFMVRVSGIQQQIAAGVEVLSIDGRSPRMQLEAIFAQVIPAVETAQRCLIEEILPRLERQGIELVHYAQLNDAQRRWADDLFNRKIYPILTPLAVGPTHPFPFISNLSLNLAMMVAAPDGESRLARVKIPLANLPRLVPVVGSSMHPPARLMFLEDLIAANLGTLFPGMLVGTPWQFRVTRDADLEIREDEADDLMSTLQQELRKRRFGQAVRLEVQHDTPPPIIEALRRGLSLSHTDVIQIQGPMAVPRLSELLSLDLPELKYRPYVPRRPAPFDKEADLYDVMRTRDVLIHHPFESFDPVVEFIQRSARDPRVVAIKQTLYRTSGDSPIIRALEEAVEDGKQVAAVVELKARFDEENNIVWARRLEEAGVHVIYGVPGLKTHSKLAMVVRREGEELVRYCHIGTGNYNPTTARIYTDLGLFTTHPGITGDVVDVFNRLTGFARPDGYEHLLVAPCHMKQHLLELIAWEAEAARSGEPGHILLKCNAITHPELIDALYAASQAGARVDLLVRGICRLIPGKAGLSERISVRSVVGRFLEHTRVYWFQHGGDPKAYIGSADLMERNLDRRVEVLAPIVDPGIARWLRQVLLQRYLDDRARTHMMQPDTSYVRLRTSADDPDVHAQFMQDPA